MAKKAEGAEGSKGLTKRKLLDQVAAENKGQRVKMRAVVDSALRQIGEALARGESVSLPPMGRISVTRTNEKGGAILRYRPAAVRGAGDNPVEPAGDSD